MAFPDRIERTMELEFTLVPVGAGTRLTVAESGFAQLGELVAYLDAA